MMHMLVTTRGITWLALALAVIGILMAWWWLPEQQKAEEKHYARAYRIETTGGMDHDQ